MIQLIKPKGQSDAKPETKPAENLQQKVAGFKFNPVGNKPTNAAPTGESNNVSATVQNASKPLIPNTKPQPSSTSKPVFKKPSAPIPEMAADKYEVVADSQAEISMAAGDKLQEQLAMLQSAIDGNCSLQDQMTNILTFLDDHPDCKDMVAPKDIAVFVAACRKVAGITVKEKTTRQTRKKKQDAVVDDIMDELADLDISI